MSLEKTQQEILQEVEEDKKIKICKDKLHYLKRKGIISFFI